MMQGNVWRVSSGMEKYFWATVPGGIADTTPGYPLSNLRFEGRPSRQPRKIIQAKSKIHCGWSATQPRSLFFPEAEDDGAGEQSHSAEEFNAGGAVHTEAKEQR